MLDRLRAFFTRPTRDDGTEGPPRRGLAITMSVLVSIILWFTLSLRKSYTDQIVMPTQVVNLEEDMALAEPAPEAVQAQVRGLGIDLFRLRIDPPTVTIDAAQDEISFEDLTFDLPEDVVFESVSPRTFRLEKEPRVSRMIPIELRFRFETPETFELLYPPALDPDSVLVSGARSVVERLEAWPTVSGSRAVQDSLVLRIPLADTLEHLVNQSHLATTVTVLAEQFTENQRWLPVEVTGVPSNQRVVSLDPSSIRVTYRVPLSQYDEARAARDFFAIVSYDDIRADTTGRVTPQIHYPPDLLIRNVEIRSQPTLRYYERLVEQ